MKNTLLKVFAVLLMAVSFYGLLVTLGKLETVSIVGSALGIVLYFSTKP